MRDTLSQRPRLDVARTTWDNLAEALAFVGLFLGLVLFLMLLIDLPSQISQAFLFSGERLAWSGRWVAILPLILALINHVLLSLMSRMPHFFHYPWPITMENAAIQYRLARSMLNWLNAVIIWMLVAITWTQMRIALGEAERFPILLFAGCLVLISTVMLLFLYRAYKCRSGDISQDPFTFDGK